MKDVEAEKKKRGRDGREKDTADTGRQHTPSEREREFEHTCVFRVDSRFDGHRH